MCKSDNKGFSVLWLVLLSLNTLLITCSSAQKPVSKTGSEQERILTREEKLAFDKFKRNVWPHLFREELKNDLFLIRWLRAKNLNVDVALKDAIALKNFYYDNNIETIADEDWSDFEQDFPFHLDGFDREGRPIGYIYLREGWDIRAVALQGKRHRMERWFVKSVFDLMLKLRDAHEKDPNVSQFTIIFNLDGLSLIQQACPLCLHSIVSLLTIYERFLPGFSKELIIVEAPPSWIIVYQAVRAVLSTHTRDAIKLFDTNRQRWTRYLHTQIDPSQLPSYLGGTKKD